MLFVVVLLLFSLLLCWFGLLDYVCLCCLRLVCLGLDVCCYFTRKILGLLGGWFVCVGLGFRRFVVACCFVFAGG